MRHVILSIGFVSLLLSGNMVYASPEVSTRPEVLASVRQLLEENSCPGCDLAGAILHRGNFSGANLEGANLAGAQLNLANLDGANLKGANLQGASFGGTDLAGADLTGANLTGAVIEGAYLAGATMDGQVVVRRLYADDEGGPEAGETVFKDAEGKSKNLPYTNQAMVTKKKVLADTPSSPEKIETASISMNSAATSSGEEKIRIMPKDPLPEKSKKLNVMEDVVVSEEVSSQQESVPATEGLIQEATKESLPAESEKVVVAAIEEPEAVTGEMPEAVEQVASELVVVPEVSKSEEEIVQEAAGESLENEKDVVAVIKAPETVPERPEAVEQVASEPVVVPEVSKSEEEIVQEAAGEILENEKDVVAVIKAPETVPAETPQAVEQGSSESIGVQEVSEPDEQIIDESVVVPEASKPVEQMMSEPEIDPAAEKKKLLVEKLLDDNRCVGCDLSGVDLSGKDLEDADLERVILKGANLREVDLEGSNLKGADMSGTDLRDADLREADLYRANIGGADLTGAKLEGALIDSMAHSGAVGVNFEGAIGTQLNSPFLKN